MIQSLTTRMAQNSFMIKGWALTLVVPCLHLLPQTEWFFLKGEKYETAVA